MKKWFREMKIKPGDEIVFQVIDRERHIYRLIPQKLFIEKVQKLESELDIAEDENTLLNNTKRIAGWTKYNDDDVVLSEYSRLAASPIEKDLSIF